MNLNFMFFKKRVYYFVIVVGFFIDVILIVLLKLNIDWLNDFIDLFIRGLKFIVVNVKWYRRK